MVASGLSQNAIADSPRQTEKTIFVTKADREEGIVDCLGCSLVVDLGPPQNSPQFDKLGGRRYVLDHDRIGNRCAPWIATEVLPNTTPWLIDTLRRVSMSTIW